MCTTKNVKLNNVQVGVLLPDANLDLHKEMKNIINGKDEHK